MENFAPKIRKLAVDLTKIRSVVGTPGEIAIARKIYEYISQIDYFRQHPDHLRLAPVPNDPLGRCNVIAIVEGQGHSSPNTVLTLGHFDTVGVDDYASCQEYATEPDILPEKLSSFHFSPEIAAAFHSDEWLFGRGIFDMKFGVAVLMTIVEHFATHVDSLTGNLVFAAVCDEEANSAGMLSAIEDIAALGKAKGWKFTGAIDTDSVTPLYPGDEKKYVYIGSVGKLLPSFYIHGTTTHVGEAFNGLDANMLAAAILLEINLNSDLCETVDGETTVPPVSLQQRDVKTEYSVQTVPGASLYFNYLTHRSTPDEVLASCSRLARTAFVKVIARLNSEYRKYCRLAGIPPCDLPWQPKIWTYDMLYSRVKSRLGTKADAIVADLVAKARTQPMDDRELCLAIVRALHQQCPDQDAKVIVYFSPPYYPHVAVTEDAERDRKFIAAVNQAVAAVRRDYPHDIVVKKYFPSLCDLSYCSLPGKKSSITHLCANMPVWGTKYRLPLDAMHSISMPVANIGPLGRDFHKISERVHLPYSLDAMPRIILKTIENLLNL